MLGEIPPRSVHLFNITSYPTRLNFKIPVYKNLSGKYDTFSCNFILIDQ